MESCRQTRGRVWTGMTDQPQQTGSAKRASVPLTAIPRTLLAQSTQCGAGGPQEPSERRPAMTHKNPTHSHVTQSKWLHELVSAEIGQGGSPAFYGITRSRCGQCPHHLWTDKGPPTSFPGSQAGENRGQEIHKKPPQVMSTPQPQGHE